MNRLVHPIAVAFVIVAYLPPMEAESEKPYLGKVFFGIEGEEVPVPEDPRYESTWGLELQRVAAMSSAREAGLRVGDIVVSIDGTVWKNEQIRLSRSFGKAGDKARPGEVASCLVLRKDQARPNAPRTLETVNVTLLRYPRTQPDQPRPPTNDELRPDLTEVRPSYQQVCWELVEEAGFRDGSLDLLRRLERCAQFPDPDRLPIVGYVLRDPFKLEAVSREIIDALAHEPERGTPRSEDFLRLARHVLLTFDKRVDQDDEPVHVEATYAGKDLTGHLAYVEQVLKAAAEWHRRAFALISEEDAKYIREHRLQLLEAFVEHKMLSYDPDFETQQQYLRVLDMAGKVAVRPLIQQARVASLLVGAPFAESLRKAAETSGKNLDAAVVAQRDTDFGKILVAGRGRTRYTGNNFAAIYELGGDDVYANNQATSVWGAIPSAVIVDYEGDDAYETHAPFTQGCGDMGVGILVDLEGSDTYVGMNFTQGTGFCGIGMLIDEAGDDVYRGMHMHQGVGHWGAGILVDRGGRDRYEAHLCSQGVGLPGGVGIIYDGGDEADSYYCKGDQASGYGTAGVFEGWGQGAGFGYRPYASGGVGVAFDQGGPDRWEGGNFSQGGGYFYGFGILYGGGDDDDHYLGSRWAQGFGCHQAAGVMIEAGGDDRYSTRYAVAQGIAWDEAVSLFVEQAGNDRYEGGGFSQGASAHNGFSIFLELGGDDVYLYTDQARAGSNDYHGGTSLSFFLDVGGGNDTYQKRANDKIMFGGESAIFVDAPRSINELLNKATRRQLREAPTTPK